MSDAPRFAGEPGLRRLLAGAAARYRELGRIGGAVALPRIEAAEARALHHLRVTGRALPRTADDARVELARLDRALVDAGAGGLLAVLRAGGHDVRTEAERRQAAARARAQAWERALGAASDRRTEEWIAALRAARGGAPPPALQTVLATLALLERDGEEWDRARLASEVAGNPHALDDGTAELGLLLAALAHREARKVPADAAGRRALLERNRIRTDPLSSSVLVVGLRATGAGPAARLLAAADGRHVVLTLAQLADSSLRVSAADVRACEGVVVTRAAERAGAVDRPLVCTDGQPSAACDALLRQLGRPLLHSGDFDWGGLRIAGVMRRRYGARPWRHEPSDYDRALELLPARTATLEPPRGAAPEGLEPLWRRISERQVPVFQEDLIEQLVGDLVAG